jgi:hypothetical protein
MMNEKDAKSARKRIPLSKIYVGTGEKVRANRERDGMSLNSDARPHELGRAPLCLGAPALICWGGRSKPSFIL